MPDSMYLEPPHLTVSVYSDHPEVETFAHMCDVAQQSDCCPQHLIEIAQFSREFDLLSDLGASREIVSLNPAEYARLIRGRESTSRAIRAEYYHSKFGKVIVEYLQKIGPDRHPIGLSLSADSFSVPEALWSGHQRWSAYAIADWTKAILESSVLVCNALYGGIGVEFSLPTPRQIKGGRPKLPTEIFVSGYLASQNNFLERELRRVFSEGEISKWESGTFFSGWAPYNSKRVTICDPGVVTEIVASTLGRALS